MSNMLIIPDIKAMPEYIQLAEQYHMGFEYNDFYMPSLLDDANEL